MINSTKKLCLLVLVAALVVPVLAFAQTQTGSTAAAPATEAKTMAHHASHHAHHAMSADMVKAAQQALKDKGNDPGPIDGKLGHKTAAAIKEFQKANSLKETGTLDAETLAKLGVAAEEKKN